MEARFISGFSKLSKQEKQKDIGEGLDDKIGFLSELEALNHKNPGTQSLLDQFSENTLGNFPIPYGIAPNFLINNKYFNVPMVTEESSVVAAASSSARFWAEKGGFHAKVSGLIKLGQIHFCWNGKPSELYDSLDDLTRHLKDNTVHLTRNMIDRGGGIRDIELIDLTSKLDNYYQLRIGFDTADSMGANFINSVLEEMSVLMENYFNDDSGFERTGRIEIIMAILSNYTPGCLVECYVETEFTSFDNFAEKLTGEEFARKFKKAVDIATIDPYRAVTHNKGIFNGADAVVIATANDFRAVEAAGHAYAARSGTYCSLSEVTITGNVFRMSISLPLAIGTVGGLTSLHPLAKWSFEILNKPDSKTLMMIIASAGLASNFAAIRSLITKGIQQGHMKMHLGNILSFLGASDDQRSKAKEYFQNRKVSHQDVEQFLKNCKDNK